MSTNDQRNNDLKLKNVINTSEDGFFDQSVLGCMPYERATDCEHVESVDGKCLILKH